jgi:hypothetical protein
MRNVLRVAALVCLLALPLYTPGPVYAQVVHSVTLSWHPTPGGAPTGYHVKRSTLPQGPFLLVASVPGTSWVDNSGPTNMLTEGATYWYVVTALRPDGSETDQSNVLGATIPTTVQQTINPPFLDSAVAK